MNAAVNSERRSVGSSRSPPGRRRAPLRLALSHHHVKVPVEQAAANGRGGATGRGLPGVQARRQWNDVCAFGILRVPQLHGDQAAQPVVATPELRDGRLLCSCRGRPSLRLRVRGAPTSISAPPRRHRLQPLDASRPLITLGAERSTMPTRLVTSSGSGRAGLHQTHIKVHHNSRPPHEVRRPPLPLTFCSLRASARSAATGPRDWATAVTECPKPLQGHHHSRSGGDRVA
eukprot:scaffold30788_cov63-Phaeocystis_antarctica.AAC.2